MSCELSFSITLSAEDTLRAQEALWRIVRRQAMLYAPESSSLPIETVTALMKSVLLTLNAAQNPAILLAPDLDALFWQGQRRLRQKAALAHVLWKRATAMQPPPKHAFCKTHCTACAIFRRAMTGAFSHRKFRAALTINYSCRSRRRWSVLIMFWSGCGGSV